MKGWINRICERCHKVVKAIPGEDGKDTCPECHQKVSLNDK
jgi:RNA polymerase subunit RPABC4/transcription elongation factor Spt4